MGSISKSVKVREEAWQQWQIQKYIIVGLE
jgi:hypothetical protein